MDEVLSWLSSELDKKYIYGLPHDLFPMLRGEEGYDENIKKIIE